MIQRQQQTGASYMGTDYVQTRGIAMYRETASSRPMSCREPYAKLDALNPVTVVWQG